MVTMELTEDTYQVIADNYGEDMADYAKNQVEGHDTDFGNVGGIQDVGTGAVMNHYFEVRGEEGLDGALEEFAQDIDKTRRLGVLKLLQAEAEDIRL